MKKDPRIYLAQLLERIVRIEGFTRSGKKSFLADPLIQDAVIRNLEVIGEASGRVGAEYQAAHPEIPWREMAGLRNILIHDYESVNFGTQRPFSQREIILAFFIRNIRATSF